MKLGLNSEIGKIIATIIIILILVFKGFIYQDLLLGIIGMLLFLYDFYWIYRLYLKSSKNNDIKLSKIEKPISENITLEIIDK